MEYYPLTLGVVRPNWNANKPALPAVSDVEAANKSVFARDEDTCQCCGFKSSKYQQVLHLNGDKKDFSTDNVLTTCIFCHQCFDLENVSKMRSGMLIWLPEMAQAELNHLMRSVYLARGAQGGLGDMSRRIFDAFYKRGEEAKKRLGSTDPGALAVVLRDFLTKKEYEQAQINMDGIRLLPLTNRMIYDDKGTEVNFFPTILAHWRKEPYLKILPQDWPKLFKDL